MKLKLVEPLRELFKDEVRKIGIELGLPSEMVYRLHYGYLTLRSGGSRQLRVAQTTLQVALGTQNEACKASLRHYASSVRAAIIALIVFIRLRKSYQR